MNHFIEIGYDEEGKSHWLTIHTGSRNFGYRIAAHHQKIAEKFIKAKVKYFEHCIKKISHNEKKTDEDIRDIKSLISAKSEWKSYKSEECFFPTKDEGAEYLSDMKFAQEYAKINRHIIAEVLLDFFSLNTDDDQVIESVHNYIDFRDNIVRKGAISAKRKEKVVIPLNMADGVVIGRGLGNEDWNCSAPHGLGRKMSRRKAKKEITMEDFQKRMEGIFTTTATENTLDEAPMAYKDKDYIIEQLKNTVEIRSIVKTIYNFKADEEEQYEKRRREKREKQAK